MCSSTTAERQSLASRDRTCCLRRCLPARPLRVYGFHGSIAHPTQSLCTLRTRRRRRPRNTRYRAPATAYPDRSLTGRNTPALPGAQAIHRRTTQGLDCSSPPRNDEGDRLRLVAAFLAAGFEQEPGAALGLVDEDFEQARGAGILMVVAKLVGLAHRSRDMLVVFHQLAQHLARRDILFIVVLDGLQFRDLPHRL